jgi:hypothetical protein
MATQLQFPLEVQPCTPDEPEAIETAIVPTQSPSITNEDVWPEPVQRERRKKPSANISTCTGCGDIVALVNRIGIKLAWTEEEITIDNINRTLYWCEECTENGSIDTIDYDQFPLRKRASAR